MNRQQSAKRLGDAEALSPVVGRFFCHGGDQTIDQSLLPLYRFAAAKRGKCVGQKMVEELRDHRVDVFSVDRRNLVQPRIDQFLQVFLQGKCQQLLVGARSHRSRLAASPSSRRPVQQQTAPGQDPAPARAPMAALPEFQRQGIGTELVRRGLDVCREQGQRIAIVLGHPEFYPRLGFSSDLARRLLSPSGEAWMAAELVPRALVGVPGRVEAGRPTTKCDAR